MEVPKTNFPNSRSKLTKTTLEAGLSLSLLLQLYSTFFLSVDDPKFTGTFSPITSFRGQYWRTFCSSTEDKIETMLAIFTLTCFSPLKWLHFFKNHILPIHFRDFTSSTWKKNIYLRIKKTVAFYNINSMNLLWDKEFLLTRLFHNSEIYI